ncbi:AAA family ATPase [Rossellomorea vietnamensis]|uniref:AAA family ATPase n=1 Tax=Rossellomorea vietnamensis TaxID=218284 RepID=A0A5D4K7N2_9BACI|nr:AAA family ATPase [Rossellomorea vietnamensis]TYR72700.1 AAA family ATPase [Rossellomorea vietnamensis]
MYQQIELPFEKRGKNGKIVSFINMKGGVGKTTLSVGVADFLAHYRGDTNLKVLIIDADPQFNATQALLDSYYEGDYFKDILPVEKTINKLFKPQVQFSQQYQSPSPEEMIIQLSSNLHIVCGDLSLVLANKSSDYTHIKRLKRFIKDNSLREIYDLIIIDCPPTLTIYTDSALFASDYYLIPNRIDRYSIIGISSLQKAIGNLTGEEDINLECLGLIYTILDDELTQKQQEMKDSFEAKEEVQQIYIFTSYTSNVKDIQVGKQGPIPTRYKKSREDLEDICAELIDRIEQGVSDE